MFLFAEKLLGVTLHPGQKKFADNRKDVNILSPANRWGKTTYLAVAHIFHSWNKSGVRQGDMKSWLGTNYLTCALAPHSQQAEVVVKTIRQIMTSTYPIMKDGKMTTNKCFLEWFMTGVTESYPMSATFANNSQTLIRSTGEDKGKSIAAKAFGYIGYDEAGKSLHLEEEMKSTLMPRLADFNGTLDLVGTPDANSPSFVYFQELFWKGGGDGNPVQEGYYSQEGSVTENPYIPTGYIKKMKNTYPKNDPYLQQVLHGKFISIGDKVFDHQKVIKCGKEMDEYLPFQKGHKYIAGIDTAIGSDELVITVIDWTTFPFQIARISACKGNSQSPQLHLQNIIDIFDHYNQENTCNIILETFNGESMRYYYDLPQSIKLKTKCFGSGRIIGVTKKTGQVDRKEDILIAGRKILDNEDIHYAETFRKLIQQLANYTQKDDKIKTDYVMSFCLAVFYATDGQPKIKTLQAITW